jgi:hypothetical protein
LLEIIEIDGDLALQCRIGAMVKRIPPLLLSTSTVYDERHAFPLKSSLNANKSEFQKEKEGAERFLKSRDIPTTGIHSSEDLFTLVAAVKDDSAGLLPTCDDQDARYEALKRSGALRLASKIIKRWMGLALAQTGNTDASMLIKLAFCFRHAGDLERALECTSQIASPSPQVRCSNMQRAVLATERAAILMDFFVARRQSAYLADARRAAGMAFAIYASARKDSPELDAVYNRLRSLEQKS